MRRGMEMKWDANLFRPASLTRSDFLLPAKRPIQIGKVHLVDPSLPFFGVVTLAADILLQEAQIAGRPQLLQPTINYPLLTTLSHTP